MWGKDIYKIQTGGTNHTSRQSRRMFIINCSLLIIFSLLTLVEVIQHEPWRDELQAWIIARDLDAPGIIYQMRYEGHFALWSLILHPFSVCGGSLLWMGLVSWGLMVVAAGLFVFRSPFTWYAKAAFLLSYPMIYYFPVVSRCYALVPPLLFGMASLYKSLPRHRLLYCFLLGVLAHTHVYMEGMVAVLFLIYCYDCIWKPWRVSSFRERAYALAGALLTVGMVLLAFLQVLPALNLRSDLGGFTYSLGETLEVMGGTVLVNEALWVQIVNYGILALLVVWFISRYARGHNLRIPLIVIGAVAWQIFFSVEVYPMMLQRAYLFLFILVFAMWIMVRQRPLLSVIVTILSIFTMHKLPEAYEDLYKPYSNVSQIAELLDRFVPEGGVVAVDNMSKVLTAYRPDYQYISIDTLEPVVTYSPHTPCRKEKIEEFSNEITEGETYYYVRSDIGMKHFGKTIKRLKGRYKVELLKLKGERALQESFYLYRVRKEK